MAVMLCMPWGPSAFAQKCPTPPINTEKSHLANLHADAIPTCAAAYHDLVPSATVHVVATFVDPEAKHFDPTKNSHIVGPVTSKIYCQFAGITHLEQLGISQPELN